MSELIKLNTIDNVATARRHLHVGEEGASSVIPKGHKMALKDIAQGEPIVKFAQVIAMLQNQYRLAPTFMLKILNFEVWIKTMSLGLTCAIMIRR